MGFVDTGRNIIKNEVNNAIVSNGASAQQVCQYQASATEDSMDHVQDRCHKKEGEFDRLGDTGNAGSQHNGHQDGLTRCLFSGRAA